MKNQARHASERGYALAVLLVGIAVSGILMSVLMPVWRTAIQREREAELAFRGEQYARAIGLFQRKFPGSFPPSVDVLVEQKFLRKKYTDPVSGDKPFRILYQADVAGLQGTVPGAARPGEIVGPPGAPPGAGGSAAASEAGKPRRGELASRMTQPSSSGFGAVGQGETGGVRGGVVGVASANDGRSLRRYNGRERYNEWLFVYAAPTGGIGGGIGGGTARPGQIGNPPPRP